MNAFVVASVMLAGGAAVAAPVASASEDLDGDGVNDALTLAADGTLTLGRSSVQLGAVVHARIEVGRWRKQPIVVVATATKAWIVGPTGATWKVLAEVPIGGQGLDADYATDLIATSIGPIRYQKRAGMNRCDGKPGLLFAEGFDGQKFRKLSKLPTEVAGNVPKLTATIDPAQDVPVVFYANVASHQPGSGDVLGLVHPEELDDGKLATQWREELTSAGEGQWFSFVARVPSTGATQLRIVPGDPTSAAAMLASSRPKTIAIVGDKVAYRVDLPDAANAPLGTAYVIDLPRPIAGCVTMILENTYGPTSAPTAIAELGVFVAGERGGGADALLANIVAEGADGAVNAELALARRGATAVAAIDAALITGAKTMHARAKLVRALTKVNDSSATPVLVRVAATGIVDGAVLVEVMQALGRRGASAELARLVRSPKLSTEARVAGVEGIAPDAIGLPALISLAGEGPFALRRAVIAQLSLAPGERLAEAAASVKTAAASGDLWRSLTRRAKARHDERAAAMAAMTAALPSAMDYERRYRLADGIATLGDAAALRALQATLAALPPGPQSAALRQVAVAGASAAPRPGAIDFIVALVRDGDPGVRMAAVRALSGMENDTAGPWHAASPDGIDRVIAVVLAADPWPEVRRRAAGALGSRCQRPTPRAALVDAVMKDKEPGVRGDALIALVECKAQGVGDLLATVWTDGDAPIELRTQAVGLVDSLEDLALATKLVGQFERWRASAIESEPALALARTAAGVIGRMTAPGAAEALMSALGDEAFPELVTAAANGLGAMGAQCPAHARTLLGEIARSDRESASAAAAAAKRCGGRAR